MMPDRQQGQSGVLQHRVAQLCWNAKLRHADQILTQTPVIVLRNVRDTPSHLMYE